jgi:hypothetical protein
MDADRIVEQQQKEARSFNRFANQSYDLSSLQYPIDID